MLSQANKKGRIHVNPPKRAGQGAVKGISCPHAAVLHNDFSQGRLITFSSRYKFCTFLYSFITKQFLSILGNSLNSCCLIFFLSPLGRGQRQYPGLT